MDKHRTKSGVADPVFSPLTPASTSRLGHPRLVLGAALREFLLAAGFRVLLEELEADRSALCGAKGKFQEGRRAYRHGHDDGQLVLGGRKIRVPKPRVRGVEGGELELPRWRHYSEEDPLSARVQEQILVGVSTRGYARSLEPLHEGLEETTVSRSSVSRRFVARTTAQVERFLSRSLGALDFPVVMIDGVGMGDHLMLTALGIEATGNKHVLGVTEGSSESEEVARGLLRHLIDRGLRVERARLFVIDGGKGVRKAIRSIFGEWALIQRCLVHKSRNIVDHLPDHKKTWVRAAVRRAWSATTTGRARELLRNLAGQLRADHPGAATSIEEGLEETLTLITLGVSGTLHRTLCSTNPIENMHGTLRKVTRNVKRWRGGSMALRWTITAMVEAERTFRRVKGYRDLAQLTAALEATVHVDALDRQEAIA
jgi:putative transposase